MCLHLKPKVTKSPEQRPWKATGTTEYSVQMSLSSRLHVLSQGGACSRRPPKIRCLCNVAVNGPSPQCRLLLLPHVWRPTPHTATGLEGTISFLSPRMEAPMSKSRAALAPSALPGSSGADMDRQIPSGARRERRTGMAPSGGNVNLNSPSAPLAAPSMRSS
jgi:hypothetical protein